MKLSIQCIFFIFIMWVQNARAKNTQYNLNLNIEISQKILKKFSKEEIKKSVSEKTLVANDCINEAFNQAGSKIQVTMKINKIHFLTQGEEQLKGYHSFEPDKNSDGSLKRHKKGSSTDTHLVSFYNTAGNYVPLLFDQSFQELIGDKKFSPVLRTENLLKERRRLLSKAWTVPLTKAEQHKVEELYEETKSLESQYEQIYKNTSIEDFTMSNTVRMELLNIYPAGFFDKVFSKESAIILAHELMHSFGGLYDKYDDPQNTAPNLMGAHGGGFTCILTKKQVEEFSKYRSQSSF